MCLNLFFFLILSSDISIPAMHMQFAHDSLLVRSSLKIRSNSQKILQNHIEQDQILKDSGVTEL